VETAPAISVPCLYEEDCRRMIYFIKAMKNGDLLLTKQLDFLQNWYASAEVRK
jgi:hypothetical protein